MRCFEDRFPRDVLKKGRARSGMRQRRTELKFYETSQGHCTQGGGWREEGCFLRLIAFLGRNQSFAKPIKVIPGGNFIHYRTGPQFAKLPLHICKLRGSFIRSQMSLLPLFDATEERQFPFIYGSTIFSHTKGSRPFCPTVA